MEINGRKVTKKELLSVVPNFPSDDRLQNWIMDGICEATDGCIVEPDGVCPHGAKSWFIVLGII